MNLKFEKYKEYLSIKHSWNGINCLTLLEDIYKKQLGIDFKETWLRVNRENGQEGITRFWFRKYGLDSVINETQYWQKVSLQELQEYDILVFTSKSGVPIHFGMYIADYHFIHIVENQYGSFQNLQSEYLTRLFGCYRYVRT